MKAIVKRLILPSLVAIAMASCTWEEIKPQKGANVSVPDSVKFSVNIMPIFTSNCTSCHTKGLQSPDLSTRTAAYTNLIYYGFIDTDTPEQSPLYVKITTGTMKVHASDNDRALILKWIQQGALNN